MRAMVTLSLLQQPSASEHLKGVSWTGSLEHPDSEVLQTLLETLVHDPNNAELTPGKEKGHAHADLWAGIHDCGHDRPVFCLPHCAGARHRTNVRRSLDQAKYLRDR